MLHFSGQDVRFIRQPQDTVVSIGGNAFFPCTYNGTRAVPHWVVNNTGYTESALPSGLIYNGTGLIVHNVNLSTNATKYKCCFEGHQGQGIINGTCSSEGTLIISSAGQS